MGAQPPLLSRRAFRAVALAGQDLRDRPTEVALAQRPLPVEGPATGYLGCWTRRHPARLLRRSILCSWRLPPDYRRMAARDGLALASSFSSSLSVGCCWNQTNCSSLSYCCPGFPIRFRHQPRTPESARAYTQNRHDRVQLN